MKTLLDSNRMPVAAALAAALVFLPGLTAAEEDQAQASADGPLEEVVVTGRFIS